MERYTMLLDWQNQYCQNGYTTQSKLQIQCNPYQITNSIFHRIRTKNLQFVLKHKRSQIAKARLRKKTELSLPDFRLYYKERNRVSLPDFRLYYKAVAIRTASHWHKNRSTDKWNRRESPEIYSHTYGHVIYYREKGIYNGE